MNFLLWSNEESGFAWKRSGNVWTTLIDEAHRFPLREAVAICQRANRRAAKRPYLVPLLAPEHVKELGGQ